MKITAVPTEQIVQIDGVDARVWHAETDAGVKFLMFVSRVAVPEGSDQAEFARALQEMPAPRQVPLAHAFDARLFLN